MFSKLKIILAAIAVSFVLVNPAFALIDTAVVTAALADGQAGIAGIGAAMLAFVAAGLGFKWLLGFLIS